MPLACPEKKVFGSRTDALRGAGDLCSGELSTEKGRAGASCGRQSPGARRGSSLVASRPGSRAMAQFVFESDLHSLLQLDAPIPNAPVARWQRKAKEATGPAPSPMRAANRSHSAGRTPGRTPGEWVEGAGIAECPAFILPPGSSSGCLTSLSLPQANLVPRFRPPLANLEVTAISPNAVLLKWRWPASS